TRSAHHSGVPKRIASGLGPDCKAVRLDPNRNGFHAPAGCIDGVDNSVEPAGNPKELPVSADVPHVGAAAAGNGPVCFDSTLGEIDHGHAARSMTSRFSHMTAAVGDVELLAIATRIEAMSAAAGENEANLLELLSVDEKHAVGFHIRDEQKRAVGRKTNVLRH